MYCIQYLTVLPSFLLIKLLFQLYIKLQKNKKNKKKTGVKYLSTCSSTGGGSDELFANVFGHDQSLSLFLSCYIFFSNRNKLAIFHKHIISGDRAAGNSWECDTKKEWIFIW